MTDNASSHGQPAAVGRSRRSVLQVGSLLLGGLGLSDLLRLRASAGAAKTVDTAVILLWLEGGPSHMETSDMKPAGSSHQSPRGFPGWMCASCCHDTANWPTGSA